VTRGRRSAAGPAIPGPTVAPESQRDVAVGTACGVGAP